MPLAFGCWTQSVSTSPCPASSGKRLGWGVGPGPPFTGWASHQHLCHLHPSGGTVAPSGAGLGLLPQSRAYVWGGCRACRISAVELQSPMNHTPNPHTHTDPASYRDGIFNFFGITIGRWPHKTHNQSFKLPRQLILQVCNEVLVGRCGGRRRWKKTGKSSYNDKNYTE